MTPRKKAAPKKSANGGRATIRDVLDVVQGTNTRIDGLHDRADETNQRVDAVVTGQQQLSKQMTELHSSMHDLREVTNERQHMMEADITAIKRPLTLLASGWTKVVAAGGIATALTGTIVRLELWRFIPGL
jgi:methyl-accepting chemotaxis protein